jgi:predicted RNA binding protein YcfA (HicA-like mRNA interferase family)
MTKREIEKLLKKAGFLKKSGGRHDIWLKKGFPPIPVPRHRGDIPEGTAKSIIKTAQLDRN